MALISEKMYCYQRYNSTILYVDNEKEQNYALLLIACLFWEELCK